jgi:hypothetical protein
MPVCGAPQICSCTNRAGIAVATPAPVSRFAPQLAVRPALAAGFVSAALKIATSVYPDNAAGAQFCYKVTEFAR